MAACASGRSEHDLHKVGDLLQGASPSQTILLLPVLYVNIDATLIPTPKDVSEFLHRDTSTRVACASLALQIIFRLFIHMPPLKDLGPSMWARVWPWIDFLHEFREHLPATITVPDRFLYSRFLEFAAVIYRATSGVVSSTPGFRVILGKGWGFLHEMPDLMASKRGLECCLTYIALLIGNLDFKDPVYFTEIVDGAGGTLNDLAGLVKTYLVDLVDGQLPWELNPPGFYLRSLVRFLFQFSHPTDPEMPLCLPLHEEFMETLHRHRVASLLVCAMDCVLATSRSDTEITCQETLQLLEHLVIGTPLGYRWLPPAILAGLVHTMTRIDARVGPDLTDHIQYLLEDILPKGLIYYHVVAAIAEILADCKQICNRQEMATPGVFDHWVKFFDLAERRVNLMRRLNDLQSVKACDNLECGKIQNRSQFRRCSGCNCFYYCNRDCQVMDWRYGGHRNHCNPSKLLSLADSCACGLDFHERQFMRAVIQEDYDTAVYSICRERMHRMASDRRLLLLTVFNYESTPVQISVRSMPDLGVSDVVEEEWKYFVDRVGHSHGRMQLHVMRVPEGSTVRIWMIPLRSNTSQVHDAILELAEATPHKYDEDVIANKIRAILDNGKDLMEIH
ncbi:hypothetical protein C8R45DRAFT_1104125 [Mycena sanguinolenta]|nr:hypothetical protein C8R45DRAFT_1104125 [Mycena sanguinolenta]